MEPRDKQQAVEEMLSKGDAMICLDSRYPDVRVPEPHRGNPDLRLILNLGFRRSIRVLPDGIQAELLFGGEPCLCWIPYESLWAVYNPQTGEGYLWPGKTPVSLRDLKADDPEDEEEGRDVKPTALSRSPGKPAAGQTPSAPTHRPRFRVIQGGKKE